MLRLFPDADRRRIQLSVAGGASSVWSADSDRLYYVNGDRELMVADIGDADGARPSTRVLMSLGPEMEGGSLQVAPDDQFLLLRSEPRITLLFNWTDLAAED